MAAICPDCAYENADAALSCNLCSRVLKKERKAAPALSAAEWFQRAMAEGQAGSLRASRDSLKRFLEAAGPELAKEIGLARQMLDALRQDGVPVGELPPGLTDEAVAKAVLLIPEILRLNESRQFAQAAAAADAALAHNPHCPNAWYHKAFALDALGQDEEAVKAFDRAISLYPDFFAAWQNKAALLCELKRWEDALPCWDRAIALKPGEGRWLEQKGKALYALGRKDEAVELTMKALEDPAFAEEYDKGNKEMFATLGLGEGPKLSREQEQQTLEALAGHDMSLAPKEVREHGEQVERQMKAQQTPASPEVQAWSEKAKAFLAQGTPVSSANALTAAERALALSPEHSPSLFFKAAALHFLGRACAAARAYGRFLDCAWANMGSQADLAKETMTMYRGAGVPSAAVPAEQEARIDQAFAKFSGQTLFEEKRYAEALALCAETLALHPGHPNAWFIKGRSLEALGRAGEAVPCFLEAGRLLPEFVNAWVFGGRILLKAGKAAEALAAAEAGLAHAQDDVSGRNTLRAMRVHCLLMTGRGEEASREIDALLADPTLDPKFRAGLAEARSGLRAGPEAQALPGAAAGHAVAAAQAGAAAGASRKGEKLGDKYEICGVLGMGGFGVVYQAYSHETRMVYALKTFRDEFLADAETRKLFKSEAQVWLELGSHPYVVRAHYIDEIFGRLYIAMEFISGDRQRPNSVEGWLKRGPVPLDQVLRWGVQFCLGMEHAARRGVRCHRDIKPANIMVGQDGAVRISDFGLAGALGLSKIMPSSQGGTVLSCSAEGGAGTPPYMPPEQFSREGRCDARSDVYAFGVTLYQLLSGRLPLVPRLPQDGSPAEGQRFWREMRHMAASTPPPPFDGPLWPVLARCLEKDPARRFQDFAQLRQPFEALLKDRTGETIAPPEPQRLASWEWNNRGLSLNDLGRFEDAAACFDRAMDAAPTDALALANKALALRGQGKPEDAAACADRALALDRDCWAAWNNKGLALLDLKRLDDAAECFERAASRKPDSIDAWTNLGLAQQAQSRHEPALACFDKVLALDPKAPAAWTSKAFSLESLGKAAEAAAAYTRAVELDPNLFAAWLNLGILRRRQGAPEDALKHYAQAARIDPESPILWFNAAVASEEAGQADAAQQAYRRFLGLNPGPGLKEQSEHARRKLVALKPPAAAVESNQRGAAFFKAGKAKEAMACFKQALALFPGYSHAWFNLGIVFDESNQPKEAFQCYAKSKEADPGFLNAWVNYGGKLSEFGRFEEAAAAYGEALRIDPKSVLALFNKGKCLSELDKTEEALACYNEAIGLDPKDTRPLNNRGCLFVRARRDEDALKDFEAVLRLEPKHYFAWNNKGEALNHLRRFSEALACFQEALKIKAFTAPWCGQGDSYQGLEQYQEALACYQKAIERYPEYAEAWHGKAVCEDRIYMEAAARASYKQFLSLPPVKTLAKETEAARSRLSELGG